MPPLSALVWQARNTVGEEPDRSRAVLPNPGPGDTVGGRAELNVAVPDDGFNQVTFGWRPVGGEDWTVLGTDDNAPYRVFHDVTDLATRTLLEYRAILKDHSGNLSVAGTYATVGDPPPPWWGPRWRWPG